MESPTNKSSSTTAGRSRPKQIVVPPPAQLSKDAVFIEAINKRMGEAEIEKTRSNQDGSPTHQHHRYRNRIQSFYAADPNYIGLRGERSTMIRHEHLAKRGMLPPEQLELQQTMALKQSMSGTLTRFSNNNMASTTQLRANFRENVRSKKAWDEAAPERDAKQDIYLKKLHKSRSRNVYGGTFTPKEPYGAWAKSAIAGTSLGKFPIGQ
jgi:hypothetical protein